MTFNPIPTMRQMAALINPDFKFIGEPVTHTQHIGGYNGAPSHTGTMLGRDSSTWSPMVGGDSSTWHHHKGTGTIMPIGPDGTATILPINPGDEDIVTILPIAPDVILDPCELGPEYFCEDDDKFRQCVKNRGLPDEERDTFEACQPARNKCLEGPARWCSSPEWFEKCIQSRGYNGPMESFAACKPYLPDDDDDDGDDDGKPGSKNCTWGPAFWCANDDNFKKCIQDRGYEGDRASFAACKPFLPDDCACPKVLRPVCADGKTYANECEAKCAGVTKWTEGKCSTNCVCPKVLKPVCADGKTYTNECVAKCAGVTKWTDGRCSTNCVCPKVLRPVCADGKTYPNECQAKCAGVTKWTDGKCSTNCMCPKVLKPVCADGKTYANECVAKYNGITSCTERMY